MKPIVLLTPIIAFTATTGILFAEHHETADKASQASQAAIPAAADIVTTRFFAPSSLRQGYDRQAGLAQRLFQDRP
jgi:hypothetical protein